MKITKNEKTIAKTKFPKKKGQSWDRSGSNRIKHKERRIGGFSGEIFVAID